jgi:DNA repair protein RecN (Recombination protein N)
MQLLENAESIKTNLHQAFVALSENDDALISQFQNITHLLQNIKQHKPELATLHQRMQSTILEMKDMADELETIQQSISTDAEHMQIVSDRLDLLNKLLKKHHAVNEDELLQMQNDFQQKIKNIEVGNDDIDLLQKEISALHQQLHKTAKSLSSNRLRASKIFEKEVNKLLVQVGMPHALLKIEHHLLEEINFSGFDNFKFLFTANKGSSLQEISKVASGGELSRLMLCIKSLVATSTHLPTLVFDEIDSGISGEVAKQVAVLLQQLAASHQVLCITHLPQIAAKGHEHYFVYKTTSGSRTLSQIKSLSENERIVEIAKMLSGNQPGEAALANAKELMN